MFLILTAAEATKVRGLSCDTAALDPRPLTDGRFILPATVLDDPAHEKHHDALKALPVAELSALAKFLPVEKDE